MDVLKAMGPFIRISQICGLFPYKINKTNYACFLKESPAILCYSKVFFVFLLLCDGGTFFTSDFTLDFSYDISARLVLLLSAATLYISFTVIFRTVVKNRKILCFWLNQLNNLCVACDPENPCKHIKTFNHRLLYFSSVYYFAVIATKYTTSEEQTLDRTSREVVFFLRLWVIHLFLKHFVIFTNYVRCYYLKVEQILVRKQKENLPETEWVKELRNLRAKDLFVKDFVEVLNAIYMPVILVQLMWFLVTLLCDITITREAGMPTLVQADWVIYICSETLLYTVVCHKATEAAQKVTQYLEGPFVNVQNTELQIEIELFSLQAQHRKLDFNVLGFFSLDCTLLYSMIGATTTYTVILLQFQTNNINAINREFEFASPKFNVTGLNASDIYFEKNITM